MFFSHPSDSHYCAKVLSHLSFLRNVCFATWRRGKYKEMVIMFPSIPPPPPSLHSSHFGVHMITLKPLSSLIDGSGLLNLVININICQIFMTLIETCVNTNKSQNFILNFILVQPIVLPEKGCFELDENITHVNYFIWHVHIWLSKSDSNFFKVPM